MLRNLLLIVIAVAAFSTSNGQNARIQFAHNCPDAAADTVDIYLNGTVWFNNVAFRNATAFVNITANVEAQIDIAPKNSVDVSESIFNYSFTPTLNEKYLLIADGILSETGYLPNIPFGLNLFIGARELSAGGSGTDLLLYNGCTDLSTFDLVETNLLQINAFDNVNYGEFRGYESIFTASYTFTVQDENNAYNIGVYDTPLAALGLGNDAVTLITSGFTSPLNNQNGPSFGLFIVLASGGPFVPLANPKALVQLIHNSADNAVSEIDLYLNGQLFLDNFEFRNATPFVEVSATTEIIFEAAPSGSLGPQDAIIAFPVTLDANENYIAAIQGIFSHSNYNPAPEPSLDFFPGALINAVESTNTDILFVHGSTDAPAIDIADYFTQETIVDALSFPQFDGYIELPTSDYIWTINANHDNTELAHFSAPLSALILDSAAITIVASGFVNPANNNNGPEMGLWYVGASGGPLMPLDVFVEEPVFARAQIIHNSADGTLQTVDIYINGVNQFDNISFRDATPFFTTQVNDPVEIAIAPQTSTSVADAFITLTNELIEAETYVLILSGMVSETGYNPLPVLHFDIFTNAREEAINSNETDILIYHGSTDSPAIDIDETSLPLVELIDNLSFGDFNPYLNLETSDEYAIKIRNDNGVIVFAEYNLPLLTLNLEGAAITAFASGFLNPINNSNGVAFHVWVALSDGTTLQLPVYVGVELVSSSSNIKLFPNPASEKISLSGELNRTSLVYYNVLNAQGQLIDSGLIQSSDASNLLQLHLENYASGLYVLELNNGQLSEKLRFSVFK